MKIKALWVPHSPNLEEELTPLLNEVKKRVLYRVRNLWRKVLCKRKELFIEAKETGYKEGLKQISEGLKLCDDLRSVIETSAEDRALTLIVHSLSNILQNLIPLSEALTIKLKTIFTHYSFPSTVTIITSTPLTCTFPCSLEIDPNLPRDEVIIRHHTGEIRYSLSQEILKDIERQLQR